MDNFIEKLKKLIRESNIEPGTISGAEIQHDTWCRFFSGKGRCNCDPRIIIRRLDPL